MIDERVLGWLSLAILLLVSALGIPGCNVEPGEEDRALTSLKKRFGQNITIKKTEFLVIEYCPDNTCEIFKTPNADAVGAVSDFAYLYLYFVSKYYYLTDWKKLPEAKAIAIDILKRYRQCPETTHQTWVGCVLKFLSDKYSIKPTFVRYDEQVRNEEPIDLEVELARSAPVHWQHE